MKLTINDLQKEAMKNLELFDAWKKPPPKRNSSNMLRCFVFQCKNLPAADKEGTSDPYIKIWTADEKASNIKFQTSTVEDNLNPIFYETLQVHYEYHNKSSAPPIILDLFDEDKDLLGLDDDDFLGRAQIDITHPCVLDQTVNEKVDANQIPKPHWHKIRAGFHKNLPVCGEILCSFVLAEDDFAF